MTRPLVMHIWRQWQSVQRLVIWRVSVKDGAHGVGVGEDAAEMTMNDGFPGHCTKVQRFENRLTPFYAGARRLVWRLLFARPQVIHLGRYRLVSWRFNPKRRAGVGVGVSEDAARAAPG